MSSMHDEWKQAIRLCLEINPPNLRELVTAQQALSVNSPMAADRVRRALRLAAAEGRLEELPEADRAVILESIASASVAESDRLAAMGDSGTVAINQRWPARDKTSYQDHAEARGETLTRFVLRACAEQVARDNRRR